MSNPVLNVSDLGVKFQTNDGSVTAVKDLSFDLQAGETLGIVGESGSGKSQTALAIMGLLESNGEATGSAIFGDQDLLQLSEAQLRKIRGAQIGMIFQDPMTALNPYLTIGRQLAVVLSTHLGLGRRDALSRCRQMLDAVRITDAARRLDMYPHELSGGMRQRVMIAAALLCEPDVLIADEPTTALDVTVQAQILELLDDLRQEFSSSIIFITHDLGIVAGHCDRVMVMQQGIARECADTDAVFYDSHDEYTRQLIKSVPRIQSESDAAPKEGSVGETVLSVDSVAVEFSMSGDGWLSAPSVLRAVDDVSLTVKAGETLGIVGESGCGKSTLARAMMNLVTATSGRVCLLGQQLPELDRQALRKARRDIQIIFQDPLASLNPRMTIGNIIAEPLETFMPSLTARQRRERVAEMLMTVGLDVSYINRYPHEFSGGQCQRIGIARALIAEPQVVICDEPVSALDVTVQAQIIELLTGLQQRLGLTLIFIAHDLAVVQQISHRIAVMYLGRIVELADSAALFARPQHPYTRALIEAVPVPDPRIEKHRIRRTLDGEVPSPLNIPDGCAFRSRCRHAIAECAQARPLLQSCADSEVACHLAGQID